MDNQDALSNDQDGHLNQEQVEDNQIADQGESQAMQDGGEKENLPEGVKDRLWRQERKHQREMRQMKSQLDGLHSRMNQPQQQDPRDMSANHFTDSSNMGGIDEQIHKAVSYALRARDDEERKAKESERMQHVHKQYRELNKHLDDTADKYDDFEDTVRGESVPYTEHMRDGALLLPRKGAGSAGEVLYKLGKNPSELDRISRLHPLDQASEMVKLSHALIRGDEAKTSSPRPLGQIKNNPVSNSPGITEKTPVSELRARMKAGWK